MIRTTGARYSCLGVAVALLISLSARAEENSSPPAPDSPSTSTVEQAPETPPPSIEPQLRQTIWIAHVLRARKATNIHELYIPQIVVPMMLHATDGRMRPLVKLVLEYNRPGWTLVGPDGVPLRPTAMEKGDQVALFAYLNGHLNEVKLTARGPKGQLERESIFIYAPDAYEFTFVSPWNAILVSIGAANMIYDQSTYGRFAALSGYVALQYNTPNRTTRLGVLGDVAMTMLSFKTSPVNAQPQLVDGHLDASYLVNKSFTSQWRTQALLGMSYTTMLPNGSHFGFSNLVSPEVGARVRYVLKRDAAWIGELSYSPLGKPLSQYGTKASLAYTWLLGSSHRAQLGFDMRFFQYEPKGASIMGQLYSLSLGFSI